MKARICLIVCLASTAAFAEESTSSNRFHLLSTRCESESESGPESTPQSPPLPVDDPSTPGCNRWEINIVADGDLTRDQGGLELPLMDINYGVGDNIQLKYEVPYVLSQSNSNGNTSALGETHLGIKYMFFEDEAAELQLGIYPQVTFVGPGSDAVSKGLATPGTIVTLPALISTRIAKIARGAIRLTANLGYNISGKPSHADFVSAAVGVGAPLTEKIAVMGGLYSEQATQALGDEAREQLVRADVGALANITRNVLIFGSIGRSLVSSDDQSHLYVLTGLRFNLSWSRPSETEKMAAAPLPTQGNLL